MRPIDTDALKADLHMVAGNNKSNKIDVREVIERIDLMRTLDVKPVVHAHWIPECPNKRNEKAYRHTCSECGRTVYDARQVSIDEMGYAFCPHCGAKMDEEEGK